MAQPTQYALPPNGDINLPQLDAHMHGIWDKILDHVEATNPNAPSNVRPALVLDWEAMRNSWMVPAMCQTGYRRYREWYGCGKRRRADSSSDSNQSDSDYQPSESG
jgi:hypothetical protein